MAENSISYSQFSMYLQCPKKWEQEYALNKRVFEQSIFTIFGTSIHEVIQDWLDICYNKTVKEADQMDLNENLKQKIVMHYQDAAEKTGHFSTPTQLQEFWQDGVAILDYIKRNRSTYFSSRDEELLGIETELKLQLPKNLTFKGFIDLVLRDKRTGRIRIIDLKTSTAGWNKYQKADKTKTAQLLLYKEFYGKQYGVDPEMIDVEYIILRRKINENGDFPMKRIQTFSPASGKPSRNKVGTALIDFMDKVFNENGTYNLDAEYPAIASSACKYCKYKDDKSICPAAKRLKK